MVETGKAELAWFKQCLADSELIEKFKKVKLAILDVDGSLTDGNIAYTADTELFREFSVQDGYAINYALSNTDLSIAFVSGKLHGSAHFRARMLGIPEHLCLDGKRDKVTIVKGMVADEKFELNQILFFGDDCFDATVKIKLPEIVFGAPSNAPFYYQDLADVTVPKPGGKHSFRLLLDLLLYLRGKHFAQDLIAKLVG